MKRFLVLLLCVVAVFLAPTAEALNKDDYDANFWAALKIDGVLDAEGEGGEEASVAAEKSETELNNLKAADVQKIDLSVEDAQSLVKQISSLKGIDNFENLSSFKAGPLTLTSLSLDSLALLEELDLNDCESLTSVAVTKSGTDTGGLKVTFPATETEGDDEDDDDNGSGEVSVAATLAEKLTSLNLSGSKLSGTLDTDLVNLADMVALTTLNLSDVTFPDGTEDAALTIPLALTKLTTLDISGSEYTALTITGISSLKSVNASGCTSLVTVTAESELPNLTTLNLSGATKLTTFASDTQGTVDMTNAPAVTMLGISKSKVVTLDLSGAKLKLVSVDASGSTELTTVKTNSTTEADSGTTVYYPAELTTLDLSGCVKFATVATKAGNGTTGLVTRAEMPKLQVLNLACTSAAPNKVIKALQLNDPSTASLVSVDVSYCTKLGTDSTVTTTANAVQGIDATGCSKLTDLVLTGVPMGEVSSGKTITGTIKATGSSLAALDVTPCTYLGELDIAGAKLTTLDVSKNTNLTKLTASTTTNPSTALTSLDLSARTSLVTVTADAASSLKELNAKGCTSLVTLSAARAALTSMDVSGCTKLEDLDVMANQLTKLDVSTCTELRKLTANNNKIAELDVTKCLKLGTKTTAGTNGALNVSNNALAKLDLRNNTELDVGTLMAAGNANYYVQVVKGKNLSGTTFNFADLGLTASDMGFVRNVKGDNTAATKIEGLIATFAEAPAEVTYDYQTGLTNSNNVSDLMDVTVEIGVEEDNGDENTDVKPVLSANTTTVDAVEGKAIDSVTITATAGANITWTSEGTLPSEVTGSGSGTTYTIGGIPVAGTAANSPYTYKVIATNGAGSDDVTITINVTTATADAQTRANNAIGLTDTELTALQNALNDTTIGNLADNVTAYSTADRTVTSADVGGKSVIRILPTFTVASAGKYALKLPGISGSGALGYYKFPSPAALADFELADDSDEEAKFYGTDGNEITTAPSTATDVYVVADYAAGSYAPVLTGGAASGGNGGSSSGGCDAGFGALALAVLGLFGLKRK